MDRSCALLLLAALAHGETHEDGERHVSPRIDPLSSSFYFDIKRKAGSVAKVQPMVQPIVQKGSCEQAKWATGIVACGIAEMVVGRWALSQMIRKASGGQYNSLGAFLRRDKAQKEAPADVVRASEPVVPEVELSTGEAGPTNSKGAIAGSSVLGLVVVAAALGRARARRARSGPGSISRSLSSCSVVESTCATTTCTSPNDSDQGSGRASSRGVSPNATPEKSRLALRRDSKPETEMESSDSDLNTDSEEEEGVGPGDNFDAAMAKAFPGGRSGRAMGRQLTEPTIGKFANGLEDEARRRSCPGSGLPFRCVSVSGAPKGNLDEVVKASTVKYGDKGFVRQRTIEYERKIDFHRICTETGGALDKDWSDEMPEYSLDLTTSFYRIGTELPADA